MNVNSFKFLDLQNESMRTFCTYQGIKNRMYLFKLFIVIAFESYIWRFVLSIRTLDIPSLLKSSQNETAYF